MKKKRTSITWDVLQADKEKKYMFPNNLAQKTKKIYIFLSLLCQLLFDWLSLKVFWDTRLYCHPNIDNVPVTRQKPALCSIGCASKTGISFPEYLEYTTYSLTQGTIQKWNNSHNAIFPKIFLISNAFSRCSTSTCIHIGAVVQQTVKYQCLSVVNS